MIRTPAKAARWRGAAWPWLLLLAALGGCTVERSNQAMRESLAELQIRLRLVQTELSDLKQAQAESDARRVEQTGDAQALQSRLDDLRQQLAALPEKMTELCPEPPTAATVTTHCETPNVQRVVVSGDKLVVGEVERVWVEPPGVSVEARIDAGASHSVLNVRDVVEFERDGNKWLRFALPDGKNTESVERPIKRLARVKDDKRPTVELRVRLGDVRETVEFTVTALSDHEYPLVLGRNFLTDVALVDVGRKHVQPAVKAGSQ